MNAAALSRPQLIVFGPIECCALCEAFHNKAHARLLIKLAEAISPRLVQIFGGIFNKTRQLGFVPQDIHRLFYSSLAAAEQKYLEAQGNAALSCGHAAKEHCAALQAVILIMAKETN